MKFCSIGHTYNYETEKLIRLFLPFEKLESVSSPDGSEVVTRLQDGEISAKVKLSDKEARFSEKINENDTDTIKEFALGRVLYNCFAEVLDFRPKWGILTGIRPGKLYSRTKNQCAQTADEIFTNKYFVHPSKLNLCRQTSESEKKIIGLSTDKSFSLYVSVPFCPTRCSYCSFVSHSVEKATELIPEYIDCLCKEISYTAKIAKELKLKLETVYIGGGTPTSITAEQLKKITLAIKNSFDLSKIREYTIEAGRPDTITAEKLSVIKQSGADRISINPQTMNDSVLKAVGRAHTALQTEQAFLLARDMGFDNINMDLIAGLPTDTLDGFKNTLQKVLSLNPESVTVHSLSFKRSSTITLNGELPDVSAGIIADGMVDYAYNTLTDSDYLPYYMYRQSKTVGNLENTGYSKQNCECLYNVYIMDETHTILACGASAVTKLKAEQKIERIFNYKYPYEYISKFDEMLARKEKIGEFYEHYFATNK